MIPGGGGAGAGRDQVLGVGEVRVGEGRACRVGKVTFLDNFAYSAPARVGLVAAGWPQSDWEPARFGSRGPLNIACLAKPETLQTKITQSLQRNNGKEPSFCTDGLKRSLRRALRCAESS